jgi:hypothetical protein
LKTYACLLLGNYRIALLTSLFQPTIFLLRIQKGAKLMGILG